MIKFLAFNVLMHNLTDLIHLLFFHHILDPHACINAMLCMSVCLYVCMHA